MSQRPPVVINLEGPVPPIGRQWCATCTMLYIGDLSSNSDVQDMARRRTEHAEASGEGTVDFLLDGTLTWRKLNIAITTAPSVYFQVPMPVCWVHIQGYDPEKGIQASHQPAERLLNGRKGQRT